MANGHTPDAFFASLPNASSHAMRIGNTSHPLCTAPDPDACMSHHSTAQQQQKSHADAET